MQNFLFSINVVAPLFLLMVTGYLLKQINFVSDSFLSGLNKFIFKFSLPLMLFQNIQIIPEGHLTNFRLINTAIVSTLAVIILMFIIAPFIVKGKGQRGSLIQSVYRSNFLIYGIPLATGMYGREALIPISILMGVIIPFYNVSAVIILSVFSETEGRVLSINSVLKDIVSNPLIVGCVIGLLFNLLHLELPTFIHKPVTEMAATATPLALFVMGGEFKFRSFRKNIYPVLFATIIRLIVIPVILIFIFISMGFRQIELSVLLCLFATPTAVASYIMAQNMGCDGDLSAEIVVTTTTLSCITIFLFVFVLRSMGYL